MQKTTKIIDLFAGPGGLSEGFSSFSDNQHHPFKTVISIEKDTFAHQTLLLRSFVRQFTTPPTAYYDYVAGKISREELFSQFPKEHQEACNEACLMELGNDKYPHEEVVQKIKQQLGDYEECIVIGGPPCQAYSLVGRSRMGNIKGFAQDPRHTLYKEYLKIIADFSPAIFVMENVKGILSSKLNGEPIFDKIKADLANPQKSIYANDNGNTYTIYSLSCDKPADKLEKNDFIIKSEEYGVPQARHRVILLGIRNDLKASPEALTPSAQVSIQDVIGDLPKLRSGLSKEADNYTAWTNAIRSFHKDAKLEKKLSRGNDFVSTKDVQKPKAHSDWYHDPNLVGVLNHETRAHIAADLQRYYYYATYGFQNNLSPKLEQLPENLLPKHKNVQKAISSKSLFNDRFRVQLANKPATTITSHISKDGHYFIHYDPKQCRSLTVREAARIQTFPDNYKFEGPRTAQYHQVGNAVPPLLATQIAQIVFNLLENGR